MLEKYRKFKTIAVKMKGINVIARTIDA